MVHIWETYPNGGGELLLALALADWAADDGTGIWASVATMAKKTRQSERAVQMQLAAMRKAGLIVVDLEGGGRRKTTTYRIPMPGYPQSHPQTTKNLHPLKSPPQKGCKPTHKRVKNTTEKGERASPDPLLTVSEPARVSARHPVDKLKGQSQRPPQPPAAPPQPFWQRSDEALLLAAAEEGISTHGLTRDALIRKLNEKQGAGA